MLASRSSLLFLLVVAVGCSSKADDASPSASGAASEVAAAFRVVPAVSGSRLQARFVTGGGARQFVGFHDTERNEDCTFQPAEAGHTRCLPVLAATVQSAVFGDAACKNPVATSTTCASGGGYAVTYGYDPSSCSSTPTELRKILQPTTATYVQTPSGCVAQTNPPATTLVTAGDVVPWTSFVDAVEAVVPGGITAEKVLVGTDGSRQHVGFQLEPSGVACAFQVLQDGVTRCVPDGGSGTVMYADAACTQALFVNDYSSQVCQSKATGFWVEPALGSCGNARAVYSIRDSSGDEVDPNGDIYSRTQGSSSVEECTSSGTAGTGGSSRRIVNADVTATLPTSPRVGTGGDRLVPALVPASPGPAMTLGWHDKDRDTDCTFELASDGKQRCLPSGPRGTVFHTDAACQSPDLVAVLDEAPCLTSRFVRVVSATCPPTTRVYEVGTTRRDLTTGSTETAPGHCPSLAGITNAVDAKEVDPTTLVEGVPLTE